MSSAGAYIIVEEKNCWRWQQWRYIRDGWDVIHVGWLRVHLERCIG